MFSVECHSLLLFYTLWDNSAWELTAKGVEVLNILRCKSRQWAETTNLSVLGRCMGDRLSSSALE